MLGENRLKINEISKAVGFLSEQSFYRFFRKAMNATPLEYRDQIGRSTDDSRM
ncbi:helix-turn-helix domain-containing protein [Paenibacillus sp. FSL K6-3182]|uniref:helix-turn-helix domain-containing protein n=1 Tax=Paenibacillus sp. FSL K6-3182 TaxID=2921495 RepID=UPI0030D15F62